MTPFVRRLLLPVLLVVALVAAVPGPGAVASSPAERSVARVSYVTGRLLTPAGRPAGGVRVTVRDASGVTVIAGPVVSGPRGYFTIRGVHEEEIALYFNGRRAGFESGFLSCRKTVVQGFGNACTHSPGALGKIRIQRR